MTRPVFPQDSWVQVRYPLTSEHEHAGRAGSPWLSGWVVTRCGPDEREICAQAPELAAWHEGEARHPTCFRDSCEIRPPEALLALYRAHPGYGDRGRASRVAAELAAQAGLQAGTARSYLYAELDGKKS